MKDEKNSVGEKIKYYRERVKKSQMDLEVEIGASTGSISRMENGVVNPTKETLLKVSQILNLNSFETASLFGLNIDSILELMRLLSEVLSEEDKDNVIRMITNDLAKKLDIKAISIFITKNNKVHAYTFTNTWFSNAILNILPIKYSDISLSLDTEDNIIIKSIKNNEILSTRNFLDIAVPAVSPIIANNIANIINHKNSIVLPLVKSNKVIGAALFTQDKEDDFSILLPILKIFCDSLAKALGNNYE